MLPILKDLSANGDLYYNLTSGTPAMYSVTMALGVQQFPGTLLRCVEKKYAPANGKQVFPVSLPFMLPKLTPVASSADVQKTFISSANAQIFEQARYKVARTKATVLILGETGVGKSMLAEHIHYYSDRANKKLISLNCAEVAGDHNMMRSELFGHEKGGFTGATGKRPGAFVQADGGTLFLDEVGEIPLAA